MTGKERLLHTLRLLQQQTDEDHQLSTAEIVAHFTEMGVPTDRKTVKTDIDTMIACGIDIVATRGTQTRYFYADRRFELPELKLLIDAVEASKFITARKSEDLVKKLTAMASEKSAEELKRHLYTTGRIKPENESIEIVSEKIDDGYSGIIFDRPAFKEMMQDITEGKINCVIVKDLSRLGREYIETAAICGVCSPRMVFGLLQSMTIWTRPMTTAATI